jgi:hypothetical protein
MRRLARGAVRPVFRRRSCESLKHVLSGGRWRRVALDARLATFLWRTGGRRSSTSLSAFSVSAVMRNGRITLPSDAGVQAAVALLRWPSRSRRSASGRTGCATMSVAPALSVEATSVAVASRQISQTPPTCHPNRAARLLRLSHSFLGHRARPPPPRADSRSGVLPLLLSHHDPGSLLEINTSHRHIPFSPMGLQPSPTAPEQQGTPAPRCLGPYV